MAGLPAAPLARGPQAALAAQPVPRQLRRWAPLGDLTDIKREIVEWSDGSKSGGSVEEGPPLRAGTLRASAAEDDEGESEGESVGAPS